MRSGAIAMALEYVWPLTTPDTKRVGIDEGHVDTKMPTASVIHDMRIQHLLGKVFMEDASVYSAGH